MSYFFHIFKCIKINSWHKTYHHPASPCDLPLAGSPWPAHLLPSPDTTAKSHTRARRSSELAWPSATWSTASPTCRYGLIAPSTQKSDTRCYSESRHFGLHYRDADEPIITNTLQLLLHGRPDKTLLGQPHTNTCVDSSSLFTITGNSLEHTPYSHNNDLHQWL